jgi:hypothetical protein
LPFRHPLPTGTIYNAPTFSGRESWFTTSGATLFVTLLCTLVTLLTFLPRAIAGDFPGQGNSADWSTALPYYNLANKELNEGRYEEASANYQIAISYYKFDPDFYTNYGVALRKLDDYTGAEQAFKQATALNPKDWMPWSDLANAYLKQNKLKETIATFERTLKCNPPAAEKIAIQRDIADIKKIMRMRGELPEPNASAANARPKRNLPRDSKPTSTVNQVTAGNKSNQKAPLDAQVKSVAPSDQIQHPLAKPEDLKKSGWDYVSK